MTNIIKLFSNSRGFRNIVRRVITVFWRFGITSRKFERLLNRYCAVTQNLGLIPSFPLTTVILKRHPKLIKKISTKDIELVVHGYIHTDYKTISAKEQARHFQKAADTFRKYQINFHGFRAPYLRISSETLEVLRNLGFLYDSSQVMYWQTITEDAYPQHGWQEYRRLLDFYQARSASKYLALPRFINDLVEVPVSMPDDESMIDRLCISDEEEMTRIWKTVLNKSYSRGELFTIQLHPERISLCEVPLTRVLQKARSLKPSVWVASLVEIAQWWKERDKFSLKLNSGGNGRYTVKANCSEKAALLLRNCKVNVPITEWSCGYYCTSAREFVAESPTRPAIGVALDTSPKAVAFLKQEGFIVEQSTQPEDYGVYLHDLADFEAVDEKPLSEMIEGSSAPLLRYWRWPDFHKSAMAVTGDIDSVTQIDFLLRLFETWRQNGRA